MVFFLTRIGMLDVRTALGEYLSYCDELEQMDTDDLQMAYSTTVSGYRVLTRNAFGQLAVESMRSIAEAARQQLQGTVKLKRCACVRVCVWGWVWGEDESQRVND